MFVQIVDDVRASFAARGISALVEEGAAARSAQPDIAENDGRVVFVTAESPIDIQAPQFIGDNPRQLWLTTFFFEVAFAGFDPANPERDLCHKRRCYGLWEATTQAIHAVYFGSYAWLSAKWSDERKIGRFGAELVAVLAIGVPLFDVASPSATPRPLPGEPKPATLPEP